MCCVLCERYTIDSLQSIKKNKKGPKFVTLDVLSINCHPKTTMDLYTKLIKRPTTFKGVTGLTLSEFYRVLKKITPPFRNKYIKHKKLSGRPSGIKGIANKLLCLLIYYRTYTTQLFLGFLFQVDTTTV